jgi:hypothetical protein
MQCSERKDGSVGKHLDYRVKPDNDKARVMSVWHFNMMVSLTKPELS